MHIHLDGKTAVVTGATGAIGYACAETLLQSGAQVALLGRQVDKLAAAEEGLEQIGAAKGFQIDLADSRAIGDRVAEVRRRMGEIDILVQTAGVMDVAPGEEITPDQWDRVLDVNCRGLFFMLQAVCVQSMMARQSGAVVNIASVAGLRGMQAPLSAAHYSASKGAVIQITRQAAVEWARHHIRVNAVAPGGVLTDRLQALGPDFLAQAAAPIPLQKLSQPADIANAVCFLVSEAARMITGQVLVIDGGGSAVGV
jgi:gluconate 5-dehydrogenase